MVNFGPAFVPLLEDLPCSNTSTQTMGFQTWRSSIFEALIWLFGVGVLAGFEFFKAFVFSKVFGRGLIGIGNRKC